jgi:hypothetical protein
MHHGTLRRSSTHGGEGLQARRTLWAMRISMATSKDLVRRCNHRSMILLRKISFEDVAQEILRTRLDHRVPALEVTSRVRHGSERKFLQEQDFAILVPFFVFIQAMRVC